MTMMMMQRVLESNNSENHQTSLNCLPEKLDYEKRTSMEVEAQLFLHQQKRIDDDEDDKSESGEELNVDVENDDNSCPVDLTHRNTREENFSFENLIQKNNNSENIIKLKSPDEQDSVLINRSESVCSDDVSRSDSPRDVVSPSVMNSHHNRRLAFSVENILDPNKFTGRQSVYSDSGSNGTVNICWKPHQDVSSSECVGEDGKHNFKILVYNEQRRIYY